MSLLSWSQINISDGFAGCSSILWEVESHLILLVGAKRARTTPASYSVVCVSHDESYSSLCSALGLFQLGDQMNCMKHQCCAYATAITFYQMIKGHIKPKFINVNNGK